MGVSVEVTEKEQGVDDGGSAGMRITFKDLTYTVVNRANKKDKLTILNQVTAYFNANQMAALMGPSGSGKTTLLDILAGRKTVGALSGSILFAGQPPSLNFLRRYTGYVEQFDTLLATFTVFEMLLYTAELKNPLAMAKGEKVERVREVISKLALEDCQDMLIGLPGERNIPGGQAKRVNIGLALVTDPRVLFLDEPTTGLDSDTANEVMTVVKGLAVRGGITICATIHSPSPYTLGLFDRLLMLLRGRTIYFGNNGADAISYFEAVPGTPPLDVAMKENVADWITNITVKADREGSGGMWADAYAASALQSANDSELEQFLSEGGRVSERTLKELGARRGTITPDWFALWVMIKYRLPANFKNPDWMWGRLVVKVMAFIMEAIKYRGLGRVRTETAVSDITALLALWIIVPSFAAVCYLPQHILLERPVYVRERADGLYRPLVYVAEKMVEEMGISALASCLASLAVFYCIRLQGLWVVFWLAHFATEAVSTATGYAIASISPNLNFVIAAIPAWAVCNIFFTWLLIRNPDIPGYWQWWARIVFPRYAWSAVMINQFGESNPVIANNQTVLDYFSLDGQSAWANLGNVTIFFAFFSTCAWAGLTWVRWQQR